MSSGGVQRIAGTFAWALCKAWEFFLRGATAIFPRTDATRILIDHFTDVQKQAAAVPRNGNKAALSGAILVVIPFRDRWFLTEKCLTSLYKQAVEGIPLVVVLADNGSIEPVTAKGISAVAAWPQRGANWTIQHQRLEGPFNFSAINNHAVKASRALGATHILFLNNDVEFRTPHDLVRLAAFAAQCPTAGAIGCTLDYPSGAVQHLCVAPGVKIVAAHPFKGRRLTNSAAWFSEPRPVAAVTGAALLVSVADFAAVGGFDEALPTVGQDVDLCLKLQKLGRSNWVVPAVRLIHHEGGSRGGPIAVSEVEYIYRKWGDFLHFNPYVSRKISRFSEQPVLSPWAWRYPWRRILSRQS